MHGCKVKGVLSVESVEFVLSHECFYTLQKKHKRSHINQDVKNLMSEEVNTKSFTVIVVLKLGVFFPIFPTQPSS